MSESQLECYWVKINVNAQVSTGAIRGLGVVNRDNSGDRLAAGFRRVRVLLPLDISELAVDVFGVKLAIRLGFFYIQLEGDSVNVMMGLTNKSKGCSPLFLLLDSISP